MQGMAVPLVMPMVGVLPVMVRVMPMARVLQVMLWMMVPLVMPMVRVLPVMLRLTVLLVMMMVGVLQVMVLGVGLCLGGCWAVLGVGPRHCWHRAWRAALLAGLPGSPVDASGVADGEGAVGDVLGAGAAVDANGEGAAGDATGVVVTGDDDDEGVVLGVGDGEGAVEAAGWPPPYPLAPR